MPQLPSLIVSPYALDVSLVHPAAHCSTSLQDPQDAHFRRGAHDTFDAEAFVAFVRSLRDPALAGQTILAPSFDHAVKDPVEDSIHILPEHRIILIEGLYVALSIPPWAAAAEELDERWVLTVEESIARERIAARHLRAGICPTREAALHRADANDLPSESSTDACQKAPKADVLPAYYPAAQMDAFCSQTSFSQSTR